MALGVESLERQPEAVRPGALARAWRDAARDYGPERGDEILLTPGRTG